MYVGIDGSEPEELSGELGDEYKDDIVVDGSTGKVSFVYSEPDSEGHDYIFRVLAILENGTTYEVRPVVEEDAVIDEEEVENYLLSAESDDVAVDTANGEQEKAPVAPVEGDNVTEDENTDADVAPGVKDDVTTDVPVVDETESYGFD